VKVCLLSDTHGHLDDRILRIAQDCNCILHAGDIGGAEVLRQLEQTRRSVTAVFGNNDVPSKWPEQERGELASLCESAILDLPGGRLVIEHGHRVNPVVQRHAKLRKRHPDARAIVYGHSHRLSIDQEKRPWVLNPGAAGRSRTFGGPSCLVLTVSTRGWKVRVHRFSTGK